MFLEALIFLSIHELKFQVTQITLIFFNLNATISAHVHTILFLEYPYRPYKKKIYVKIYVKKERKDVVDENCNGRSDIIPKRKKRKANLIP